MKKIFFDMDGVLAEYRKNCTEEDMKKKGYFYSLEPEKNMIEALNMLLENGEELGVGVCVLTKVYPSEFKYSVREKLEWRDKYLPELFDSEFVMVNGDEEEKSDVVKALIGAGLDENYILIDDYNPNLAEWRNAGGEVIKFVNKINDSKRSFVGKRINYKMSPEELYLSILAFAGIIVGEKAVA
ncbi:MAG: hypothetical protein IJT65_03325 [Eubacterium sp.]|nr:hypothetical protein [Eubacterium sp.]